MSDLNQVMLLGRIAKEPELRTVKDKSICRLIVAVNRSHKQDKADFFEVTVWNKSAENCKKYLEVGQQVLIDGYLEKQTWEKDGETKYKIAIIARSVQFLSKRKQEADV